MNTKIKPALTHMGLVIVFALSFAPAAWAARKANTGNAGELALGFILGSPTGLSAKYWVGNSNAIDMALGVPFSSDIKLNFHMDYLWHFPLRAELPGKFDFYAGAGGRLRAIDKPKESANADFGVRAPIGLAYVHPDIPFDFFAELAPVIVFVPYGSVGLDGGVGARFKFR